MPTDRLGRERVGRPAYRIATMNEAGRLSEAAVAGAVALAAPPRKNVTSS